MANSGALTVRITDLIGSQYNTDASYEGDLINAAINEVADMLPVEILIKYSRTPGQLTSNSEWLTEDRKILQVTRIDANTGGIERICTEVNRARFAVAGDSDSIYEATAYSPIFHHDTANAGVGTLKILPEPTASQIGKIWYFAYASGDNTAITQASLNTSLFMPSNLIHAIALKSCVNILKAYISNQVQDEEDSEMVSMVNAQIQVLEKDFLSEMQRYIPDTQKPKGE
jgi:type II secretory pathway component GspD/PulD (secretin)